MLSNTKAIYHQATKSLMTVKYQHFDLLSLEKSVCELVTVVPQIFPRKAQAHKLLSWEIKTGSFYIQCIINNNITMGTLGKRLFPRDFMWDVSTRRPCWVLLSCLTFTIKAYSYFQFPLSAANNHTLLGTTGRTLYHLSNLQLFHPCQGNLLWVSLLYLGF